MIETERIEELRAEVEKAREALAEASKNLLSELKPTDEEQQVAEFIVDHDDWRILSNSEKRWDIDAWKAESVIEGRIRAEYEAEHKA